jgi:hypothetical protein
MLDLKKLRLFQLKDLLCLLQFLTLDLIIKVHHHKVIDHNQVVSTQDRFKIKLQFKTHFQVQCQVRSTVLLQIKEVINLSDHHQWSTDNHHFSHHQVLLQCNKLNHRAHHRVLHKVHLQWDKLHP